MAIKSLLTILMLSVLLPLAGAELYPFDDDVKRQQFQQLNRQFRCLVCQNQDLASSAAGLAEDLRQQIYQLVLQDKSNAEIRQYMQDRYGTFILFSPPWRWQTSLLWLAPLFFVLMGILCVGWVIKKNAAKEVNDVS